MSHVVSICDCGKEADDVVGCILCGGRLCWECGDPTLGICGRPGCAPKEGR